MRTLNGLNNSLLHELADGLSEYWKIRYYPPPYANLTETSFVFNFCSPGWIQDIAELLEKIYTQPIYLESNPNPENEITLLEDPIKVNYFSIETVVF